MKSLDYLGSKPELTIDNSVRIKTQLGAMFTIVLSILSILLFIGFGIDMIEKKKPNSFTTKSFTNSPKIKGSDLFYMIGFSGPESSKISNITNKFRLFLVYAIIDSSKEDKYVDEFVDLIPCQETSLFKNKRSDVLERNKLSFSNVTQSLVNPLEDYFCLPDSFNRDLYGVGDSANYSIYQFAVMICSDSDKCETLENIQKEVPYYFLHFAFMDFFVDVNDYENPVKAYLNSLVFVGVPGDVVTNRIKKKIVTFSSDSGLILDSPKEDNFYQIHSESTLAFDKIENQLIQTVTVDLINFEDKYFRSYLKIQSVLASMGGFIKVFMLVFQIVNDYFTKFHLIELTSKFLQKEQMSNNFSLAASKMMQRPDNPITYQNPLTRNTNFNNNKKLSNKPEVQNVPNSHLNYEEDNSYSGLISDPLLFCEKLLFMNCLRTKRISDKFKQYDDIYENIIMKRTNILEIMRIFNKAESEIENKSPIE